MDNITNEPFLAKRAKFAKWGSYAGFGSLLLGLLTSRQQPLLSYAFLLVGLLAAAIGAYLSNRYVRQPRTDQSIAQALEELDRRYALYNYYLPSQHVLASHFGLTVLLPRQNPGEVRYSNGHWRHKAGVRRLMQFLGEPSLGRPDREMAEEVAMVDKWIGARMPNEEIPVRGAIVFTNPRTTLEVVGDAPPIVLLADLARTMKENPGDAPVLTTARQKELRRVLDERVAQG